MEQSGGKARVEEPLRVGAAAGPQWGPLAELLRVAGRLPVVTQAVAASGNR